MMQSDTWMLVSIELQHTQYLSVETCRVSLFKWTTQSPDQSAVVEEKGMMGCEGYEDRATLVFL